MKKALVLLIALLGLISIQLPAQKTMIASPFYFGGGFSVPLGLTATVGGYSRYGLGGSITYHKTWPKDINLPSDYDGGDFFGFESSNTIRDEFSFVSVRVLKEVATDSESLNFGIEIGPSFVSSSVADNFVPFPNPCGFLGCASNYTYEKIEKKLLGLSLRGKLEAAIFRGAVSLELGVNANVNSVRNHFGIDLVGTIHPWRRWNS